MDRSRAWKLTASTHPQVVQKTWTIRNRYGYRYAKVCIFPTVSLSNGRCLARLRDIRTWYGKKGLLCLTLLSCKVTSQGRCNSLYCNKRNIVVSNLNFGNISPARGGFQNLQQIKRHDGRQPHPHQTNSTMADNHMHILYLAKTRQLEVVERQEGKVEPGGRAG